MVTLYTSPAAPTAAGDERHRGGGQYAGHIAKGAVAGEGIKDGETL